MKQPELGKKIAELRKAKALTQEELVETCNLSVRTLQRIESGEVSPRSYTIKVIFSALDYSFTDLIFPEMEKLGNSRTKFSIWLEQFYLYVLDLFNLKTNTMKKITFLTVIVSFIGIGLLLINTDTFAHSPANVKKTIEETNKKFISDFNSGNINSLLEFYNDDACLLPMNCCEKSCIQEYWSMEYNKGYKITEIEILSVSVNDDMAIEKGNWKIAWPAGPEISGMYLIEWRNIKGTWVKISEMNGVDI